jgi:kinesin family protein C2/C3
MFTAARDEGRGALISLETGSKEFLVVRRGVLRIFEGPQKARGPAASSIMLAYRCQVKAQKGNLEISCQVPIDCEYGFNAGGRQEAEAWREALLKSAAESQKRARGYLNFLKDGCTAYKYNYSNSKRMRRHFWVDEANVELCWGKSRSDEPQTISLAEAVGIIYGPLTTTFMRITAPEDPAWCCFSLLFPDRTLDMAVPGDHIEKWFLGLQDLLLSRSTNIRSTLSEPHFVFRKVFYKLRDAAHRQGFTTRTFLHRTVSALGKDKHFLQAMKQNGGSSKAFSASTDAEADAKKEKKRRKEKAEADGVSPGATSRSRKSKASENGSSALNGSSSPGLEHQEQELQKMVAQLENELETQTARLDALKPKWTSQLGSAMPMDGLQDVLRSEGKVEWQYEKCTEIEREVLSLKCTNIGMTDQVQAADKAEKLLKKLAKQFKDCESQCSGMEQELAAAQSGAQTSETAKFSSKDAEVRAEAHTKSLEKRVKELQLQLQETEKGQDLSAEYKKKNKQQVEELASIEKDKESLKLKIDALSKECKAAEKKHHDNEQRQESCKRLSGTLVSSLKATQKEIVKLKEVHKQVKTECDSEMRYIADRIPLLKGGMDNMVAEHDNLIERHREIMEERKKLHNLVLELKGNIRVFVRVRPINEKEKAQEGTEATITFSEDTKCSVWAEDQGRRKWFEFDRCFPPTVMQPEVFEEVKPLATSVLDGYNVCIFAYGQTGSGKTYTMTGNEQNPGLNTRVLSELFRIKTERRIDIETRLWISVTEIYNEQIKDLLGGKSTLGKKLDVKLNSDGTNTVPGLTEIECHTVDEVLKCMSDSASNRTVMKTDMNDESSRSHSIVQVKTVCTHLKDKKEFSGKISLIDLAGSENTNKSGVTGQGMKEAQNINKSLSALGDVISSLVSKNGHIPYRNSKLTMMLKDSLGGDSKTLMIVQSSPAQCNVIETLSSLNFASRARNVELGKAKKNVKSAE